MIIRRLLIRDGLVKFHRAAVLVLVGWYLMVPPLTQTGPDSFNLPPDTSAPLSKWTYSPFDHFDTEEECKAELDGRRESARRGTNRQPMMNELGHSLGSAMSTYANEMQKAARCVIDTDPGIERK
ncbi:MAG: hypothetical protein ACREQB_12480 [Candidatus Binataceae bacterium]